ncbi:MAG: DUF3536 domain-containing protein [Deltaproteobacteria bacterium]|nr:DUF3536 domain-containing protein [Deltaproteobacteria bacterium]
MERYICIHGHFYQPPRENPWLEEVELQDSAYPYHDWNERITAECYAPNTASRILDLDGRIVDIVNNYSKISFNFGPTLLSWLERHKPDVYQAILEADKLSMERFSGHGSAMAQVYNHMIMPLANKRDKYTQAVWGIKDFQKRFGRFPEGMWLPETAADTETLEVLAELGIKFTILAPRQAKRVRRIGRSGKWQDVSGARIDPTRPYRCVLPSGRAIDLFFYDGPIAQDIAFGGVLSNGESFAGRLLTAFADYRNWPQLVHIATDGETYGHHHRHGDMALAYCLHFIESGNFAKITNYGEYLEKHPPAHLVEIFDNSSWSCIHGIERWRDNCGCSSGMNPGWTQAWRSPFREAMDRLRDRLIPYYEKETAKYLRDPWEARNDYIEVVLDRTEGNVKRFLERYAIRRLSKEEEMRILKLLEMKRNALLMYTSCGWFFDEVSGIETVQVMQYASKAMQYLEDLHDVSLEAQYLKDLGKAPSNVFENGARCYEMFAKPARVDLLRVGAHYGISSVFEEYPEYIKIFCYTAKSQIYERVEAGRLKFAVGKATIVSDISWDEKIISFAVLYLGDHNINGGVREFIGDEAFTAMRQEIREAFERGDIPEVIRRMDKHFGANNYNVWHLFRDEQRKILDQILQLTYDGIEGAYRQIYDNNYTVMNLLQTLHAPLPRPLSIAAEYTINRDLGKIFEQEDVDVEKLEALINEAKKWSVEIDKTTVQFVAGARINSLIERLHEEPEDVELLESIDNVLRLLVSVPVELDLWKAQNLYFSIGGKLYSPMTDRAVTEDGPAKRWLELFRKLGYYLHVKFQG